MTVCTPCLEFTATIKVRGINPFVHVSAARAKRIRPDWRRPMPVLVRIDGVEEQRQVNMMPVGDGSFYLYLDSRIRQGAGVDAGDKATFEVTFDRAYIPGPQHEMPSALADGLAASETAMSGWTDLSPSLQKEILRYLATLKSEMAMQRNTERVLRMMSGAKEHFLARDWN